jgi:hypothetical protein
VRDRSAVTASVSAVFHSRTTSFDTRSVVRIACAVSRRTTSRRSSISRTPVVVRPTISTSAPFSAPSTVDDSRVS